MPSAVRRGAVVAGILALVLVGTTGATPFTRGLTYRLRMSSRLPAQMAGFAGGEGPLVLAKATAVGDRARFDLLAFQPTPPSISLDDYILVLDSAQTVFVNPDEKTFTDGNGLLGGGGLGMLGQLAGRRGGGRGGAAGGGGVGQMDITNIVTDFENVGADTVIEGRQVQHYRIVAEMNVLVMAQQAPLRIVIDTWTAKLPYHIVNPFDRTLTVSPDDPAAKLTTTLNALRKKIEGTPVKSVVTTSITMGGGSISLDFVQTSTITDIKEVDVDDQSLAIPAGFTKKP